MEVVFQDVGDISFVNNKTVEQFISVMVRYEQSNELSSGPFWLKVVEENHWNRFFVESICATWEIYPSLDQRDLDEPDDFPVLDLGKIHDLIGTKVESIVAEDSELDGKPCVILRVAFSSGHKLVVSESEEKSRMEITSP